MPPSCAHQELPSPSGGGSPGLLGGELSEAIPALSSEVLPGGDPDQLEAGVGFIQRQVSGAQVRVRSQACVGGFSVKLGPRGLFSPGASRAGPQSASVTCGEVSGQLHKPSSGSPSPHSVRPVWWSPRLALPNPPGEYQRGGLVFPHGSFEVRGKQIEYMQV